MNDAVERIVSCFEGLTPERVALPGTIYADDARFCDPFNAVQGCGGNPARLPPHVPGAGPRRRITMHQDYWDAAHGRYEKMPLIGVAMHWLRRRAAA